MNNTIVSLGAALLIAGGMLAAPASATAAPIDGGGPTTNRPCAYEYQAQCVTWVTTDYSCYHIFEITSDTRKHKACSIWYSTGLVTVWP